MQSNQLVATQLMSSFLASTKGQIAQKIHASQFSQELMTQHNSLPHNNVQRTANQNQSHPSDSSDSGTADTTSSTNSKIRHQHSADDNQDKPKQKSKKSSSKHRSAAEIESQLVFNNPLVLENVINHLQLTASTRDACKAAEDDQGRISLKALYDILNKAGSTKPLLNKQGGASAESVQELMASLTQVEAGSQQFSPTVQVKPKGTYDIKEFRQLLQGIVSQIQDNDAKPSTSDTSKTAASTDSGLDSGTGGDTQQTGNFEKIPSISTSSIPTPLAEAVDQRTPGRHPAPQPAQNATTKQHVAANQQTTVQAAAKQQVDAQTVKQMASAAGKSADPASPQNAPPGQPGKKPQASSSTSSTNSSGSGRPDPAPANASVQNSNQAEAATAQSTAGESNNVSLTQLSSPDTTIVASLQKGTSTGKSDGNPQQPATSTDSASGPSGTSQSAAQIRMEQSANNSFGQQGQSQKNDNFSSATPGDKTPGLQAAGFSQLTPNGPLQTGALGGSANSAQAGTTLSMQDPSWPEKLSQQLQGMHDQGSTQLTLELDPKDLGHLTLHIETQQNQIHAFISTDNEQAKALLMQNAASLRSSLQEQGLMLGQMQVDVRSDTNSGQTADQQKSRSRKVSKKTGIQSAQPTNTAATRTYYRPGHQNQIISLFT